MKETGKGGLQDKIVASLRKQGGDALKTNGSFIKGTLDLIFSFPGINLRLAEVKLIKLNTFEFAHRAIETSAMQRETLRRFAPYSIQLIGVEVKRATPRLYICGPDRLVLFPDMHYVEYNRVFDMKKLLGMYYGKVWD